ncbi:MAG: hypothetical protein KDI39_06045 [Pseudomonadales bacterium]|nr:hypothetical protein [Pseudomonadales bacterium]
MSHHAQLSIEFQNFWHAGSGRSSGHHLDAVCLKDKNQLPYFPGRQLKGILRQAVRRAEAWGWYQSMPLESGLAQNYEELLFGSNSQDSERNHTFAGVLQVDNANLSELEYTYLQSPDQAQLREFLFDELFSTAIDDNGTAKKHSLRGIEVCMPTQLVAPLTLQLTALDHSHQQQQQKWLGTSDPWQILRTALPLIDALGAHRSRGLGEAILSLQVKGS